jgi:hypothetical protein
MKTRIKKFLSDYNKFHTGQSWIIAHIYEKQHNNETSAKFLFEEFRKRNIY